MRRRSWIAGLALLIVPQSVAGHDVDVTSVARVFLDELAEGRYALSVVDLKVPDIRNARSVLPPHCSAAPGAGGPDRILLFQCERDLTFDDVITLPWALEGVVVLAHWRNGARASAFFRGDGASVPVRLAELRAGARSMGRLAARYFALGGEHILSGIDHLLFVMGLLLLVQGAWLLVKTITAFTVAHSITLGAAVLGHVPSESGPVEAAIALSIVLLAREVVVGWRGNRHLVHRKPWVVAFAFGLLHGLGFAGALTSIGLPGGDIPLALLFFNLGVEAGQIVFVGALLVGHHALRRLDLRVSRLQPAVGYALGAIAMLWVFDRLPAVWGG